MTEHLQINDVAPCIQYDCDGIQAAYIYPFAVFRTADLEVWRDGARVNSGFSVSGAGISSGGVVLFAVPPAQGSRLTLRRRVALERISDFQTDGIIRAKTLNDELDYQVAAVQQVADDVSRCVHRPFTSASTADLSLPEPAGGRALKWSADGLSLINSDYDPDQVNLAAATVLNAAAAAQDSGAAAAAARVGAEAAAASAVASASALAFPGAIGKGGQYLRQKADESGWEYRTPPQVLDDIGGLNAAGVAAATQGLRDQTALTNLRQMLNSAVTSGALMQGYQWELTADEWASGSSGGTFNAGYPGNYANYSSGNLTSLSGWFLYGGGTFESISSGVLTCTGSATGAWSNTALLAGDFDLNVTIASAYNGAFGSHGDVYQVGYAATAPTSPYAAAYDRNVAGDVYIGLPGPGAGQTVTLYNARASLGTWTGTISQNDVFVLRRRGSVFSVLKNGATIITSASGQPTGSGYLVLAEGGTSNVTIQYSSVSWESVFPANNMVLVSPTVPVSSAPTAMDGYFLWKDVGASAVLGTDLAVDLSRDGGTTWSPATLSTLAVYDATYTVIKARADLSGQPVGSSMKMRIRTLNLKAQRIAAPALYKE